MTESGISSRVKKYRLRERAHPELIPDLLHARGVVGDEATARFLHPEYERDSHDPLLLPDMAKAVERILSANKSGEKIAVWSDYDCDGIPGGVLLTEFLRKIGLTVAHYIPHRHKEGYGLNISGLDELAEQGITLVITVDLGTTENESIAHAHTKGIDVIVTDHHIVSSSDGAAFARTLGAYALINPKRPDSLYPFDGLCGAGVAWKLVQAILSKNRPESFGEGREKWLLDLVGIATLSDMVPLVGENRMLAKFGLHVLRKNRRPGFAALLQVLRIQPHALTEDDVGFMIAPRINAASRMDSPQIAASLLASSNPAEAKELAKELNGINDERKGLVASIVKEVNKRLVGVDLSESPAIVMGNPNWRPGVLGLVANSLMQTHGKVVFLWGREGGEIIRGSCRSGGGVNVVEVMGSMPDMFGHFGGHHAAGGFSLPQERVHELPLRIRLAILSLAGLDIGVPEVVVDRELDFEDISMAHKQLLQMAPFGVDNAKPLFIIPSVSISKVRMFGKNTDHLELVFGRPGAEISGVSFFSTPESFQKNITVGTSADIVGHVETDWRGKPRLRVVDVI